MAKSVSLLPDWLRLVTCRLLGLIVDSYMYVCIVLYLTGTCHNFKWIEKRPHLCGVLACMYIQWLLFSFW